MIYLMRLCTPEKDKQKNMYDNFGVVLKAYFTSDTYKPKVPYVEGSYSLLVQHFYDFWDGTLCDNIEEAWMLLSRFMSLMIYLM